MINKLIQMGEARTTSNVRRNEIEFQEIARKNRIDRTETSFAGKSKMTQRDLKAAAQRRRRLSKEW